ncbi:MAG: deoxyguanosinetriphosphate triphosphohydrolase [Anaerolineae bacterium]
MLSREDYEKLEAAQLAPYAMKSRDSRGRVHPEVEHPYRSRYQRDRDRVIHTTAFRRLQYKTQVFIYYEGDYYRTRLTHTIEAAQIGRTLARALRSNEDLVEAITLAHDLGHTPFGHAGEEALHELMKEHGGFNHTMQTLRIVEELEQRYSSFRGLNLTWEVREGIIKHTTEYDQADATGYEPDKRPTLEAQLVNAADEIAYNTHDLDDGLRSGMIDPTDLDGIELWDQAMRVVGEEYSELTRHRAIKYLINLEVTELIKATTQRLQESGVSSPEEIRELASQAVGFSEEMAAKNRQLKDFLMEKLYRHHRVVRMGVKARRLMMQLFNAYLQEPAQLPRKTQERLEKEELSRVICDYIAGMTDRYALEEHRKLFEPGQPS